jgi:hypothetical protein
VRASYEVPADEEILTPTVRSFFRKALFWIVVVTIILAIAVVGLLFSSALLPADEPLGPESAAPEGAKALVQVLGNEGVDVSIVTSLAAAGRAIDDPSSTTLVVNDSSGLLTDEQWREVGGLADTVVLLDPAFGALTELAPDVYQSGLVDDETLEADCDLPAAEAAGAITGAGTGFRTTGDTLATCFDSGDETFSLVQVERSGTVISFLGATVALSNGRIVEEGNAAFALTLLGSQPQLVWYTPGLDDLEGGAPATIADYSPDWVVPVMITLLLSFIATAIWRGRRFGPLIVENLPVTVRASETMHGRARLYQHSSARLHALDSLRIGAIDRLARLVGLPRLATVDEVITTVAGLAGRDERELRSLLVDAVPQNDRELVELSDQLLILEAAVTSRLRPQ